METETRLLGYCTNVHAGADWSQTKRNLEQFAAAVRANVTCRGPLPIGLWLSHAALAEVIDAGGGSPQVHELAAICDTLDVLPFTFNGFPYGNFHGKTVKRAVYEPAWDQPDRLAYTIELARLHAHLAAGKAPPARGFERSISTLPIGWGDPARMTVDLEAAIMNLRTAADQLAQLHEQTGVMVHLDIEPEPGCIVETSRDVVAMFEQLLRDAEDETIIRRHLRVCHDICHAAVMFEEQADVLQRYRAAGISVGKVQVSSALRVDLRNKSDRERVDALAALRPFAEDRYLHQTMIDFGGSRTFHEDLPDALREFGRSDRAGDEWRVHYHVPVFLERIGETDTTQYAIKDCFAALRPEDDVRHFEVETYTWNVLPEHMRDMALAEGIARELQWVEGILNDADK